MSKLTTIEKELVKKLYTIWDDDEFVLGIICDLDDDYERKFVLDFIESTDDVTPEQIILLALNIKDAITEDLIVDDFSIIKNNVEIK